MGKKPTYEELEQRIRDLGQVASKRDEEDKEAKERYISLFDRSLFSVFVLDLVGNFLDANDAALALMGYTKKEMTSLNIASILDENQLRMALEVLEEIVCTGFQDRPAEYKVRRKDGRSVWVETEGSMICRQGKPFVIQGVARDITHRKLAEEALQESERRYKTLVDNARDVIYAISKELTITSLNPAFEKATGWSRSEWIGKRLEEIVHPDDWPLALEMGKRSFKGEKPPIHEVRIRSKHSGFITAEFSIAEQTEDDRVVGIIGIGRDITERKRMEEELQKAKRLESLGVLAGGIAHDFNNILTPILASISVARAFGKFDDGIAEALTDAEKACLRAKGLTRQLLTFSKGGEPAKKSVPISRLLRDEVRFALSGSNVECKYAVPEDLWWVEMDEGQVGQVIQNIIINADQAMPAGGTVNIQAANVMVRPSDPLPLKEGKYVRISISDQGSGIPKKHLPRIFDPFYSTKDKGSGLGLSICHTIIERHHGTIQVESELGTGTAFHIYLPSLEKELAVEEKEWTKTLWGVGRILLIDDDEAVRRSTEEILNRLGYEAECVKDGKEGLRRYLRAKESGRPFGAVIMDLTIPGGMGGKEAIKRLKEKDPCARVIVSSGYSDDPVLQGFREYGFSGVVAKPYGMDDLAEVIRSVLSGHSRSIVL